MATRSKSRARPANAGGGAPVAMVSALHQIYLAGLGAASRAFSGAPELFEELIAEGARVQTEKRGAAERKLQELIGEARTTVSARAGQVRGRTAETLEGLEKMFETRVHRALTQLGVPSAEQLAALSKRVDQLNANIERLASRPAGARTTPRKRTRRSVSAS